MKSVHCLHPFIHKMFLRNAFNAAVNRRVVYSEDATQSGKNGFRDQCKELLTSLGNRYKAEEWDLELFCDEIVNFIKTISTSHNAVLVGGVFRVGTAQKMISLYLKYLWLAGDPSKRPIAAVIDRQILQAIKYTKVRNWTDIVDISTYKEIQDKISEKATSDGFESAAAWEEAEWDSRSKQKARNLGIPGFR